MWHRGAAGSIAPDVDLDSALTTRVSAGEPSAKDDMGGLLKE